MMMSLLMLLQTLDLLLLWLSSSPCCNQLSSIPCSSCLSGFVGSLYNGLIIVSSSATLLFTGRFPRNIDLFIAKGADPVVCAHCLWLWICPVAFDRYCPTQGGVVEQRAQDAERGPTR